LKSFFGDQTVYDITRTTSSGNQAYFPTNDTTVTKALVISALSGMKNSDNTPINLNQLECSADPV
jgi:hypothetical protein